MEQLKNMVTFIKSLFKQNEETEPQPSTYHYLWNLVIVMDATERSSAFGDGFALATHRRAKAHEVATGQRLMQICNMIQHCVDPLGEEEGVSLAKEQLAGMYVGR